MHQVANRVSDSDLVTKSKMAAASANVSYDLLNDLLVGGGNSNGTYGLGLVTQVPSASGVETAEDQAEYNKIHVQLTLTRFVVWKILVPMTVSFGVISNCISIAVLTRRSMRTSTNVYLTALALCDVLYLVFALSLGLKHYQSIHESLHYKRFRKPFGMALVDTFSNTGVWLTLTFTIERYIGVCHPMKGKVLCTPQRARIVVTIVCFCTFILTFPEFFSFRSVTKVINNKTVVDYEPILEANSSYQWGFKYLHQVLFTLGPLVLLLIFNSLLMRAVLTAAKARRTMAKVAVVQNDRQDRHHREQQKITLMLIMVVIVFLLCQLPQAITNLYYTYLGVTKQATRVITLRIIITANVCNLLVMINSSANFILYSAFSTKFRRTFKQIFCKCLVRKKTPDHVISDMYNNSQTGVSTGDGSKTNLIMRAQQQLNSHLANHRSPHRYKRPVNTQITTISSSTNSSVASSGGGKDNTNNGGSKNSNSGNATTQAVKSKTKNGYLAVDQTHKGVSSV